MREYLMFYGTGLAAMIGISAAWVWVQTARRRVVAPEEKADLLGDAGCVGCGHAAGCGGMGLAGSEHD